jgi:undecaprenyl diphosphate synthase
LRKPRHIGIIMDGNGRWAQLRGKPRTFGHIKGTRTAKKVITACRQKGVEYLTLYAFSTENWLRPIEEVSFLMNLLRRYIKRETSNLIKQNIRFVTIGDINRLPPDLVKALEATVKATEKNTGMVLTFALSYGSRWEIVRAAKILIEKVQRGELSAEEINEQSFGSQLLSNPAPDLDVIIRTSGETRLSNFMLWQAAYAELFFTETLWPDFDINELDEILLKFIRIERRFGTIKNHENVLN